jgi:hypothetical protein
MVANEGRFEIDRMCFNDHAWVRRRVEKAPAGQRSALDSALRYLYLDDGPLNLPRDRLQLAFDLLEGPEQVVVRWLYTRTNGSLRKSYGKGALREARAARYRCRQCGFADVRALNIDHVDGRVAETIFACLCANCHTIKSRTLDWTGLKRSAVSPDDEARNT